MVPKWSTNQKRLQADARDVFQARLSWQDNGEVKQRQYFCHHEDTMCHPKSGYVITKLHGTSTCRCNYIAIFSDKSYFQVSCRLRMSATLVWPQGNLAVHAKMERWQHS